MSNEDIEKRLKALEDFAFNIDKIVKQPAPVSNVKEQLDEIKELLQKRQTEWLQLDDLYKSEKENKGRVFRDTLKDGGEGPAMVVLPPGRFRMGDLDGSGFSEERPVHTVTISRPIAMGRYPVTFEGYDRFVAATEDRGFLKALFRKKLKRPGAAGWGRGKRPVINVNWHDAKAYVAWLSEQTGKRYRLPSESEWEYAARARTETAYSWGNEIGANRTNSVDSGSKWSDRKTSPVGSFAPNGFGLYDMHGNVWEWVEDCWHYNYEGAPSDGSAWTNGGDSDRRVVRGGAWDSDPRGLRAAHRFSACPSERSGIGGFRLALDLNP